MSTSKLKDTRIEAFQPLRPKNLAEAVVVVIVDAIRGGLYEPGERLPTTRELAAALEVGPAVIGEALGILERAGIVSVRRGAHGGAFVETRWVPQEVVARIEGETYASLQSLLEVRRLLETHAALSAAGRMTKEVAQTLRELVEKLPDLMGNPEEFLAVDMQFHIRLADASGNDVLARLIRETLSQFMTERSVYPVGHIDMERAVEFHRDTLAALIDGSPDKIAQTIDEHLGAVEHYYLGKRLDPALQAVRRPVD